MTYLAIKMIYGIPFAWITSLEMVCVHAEKTILKNQDYRYIHIYAQEYYNILANFLAG